MPGMPRPRQERTRVRSQQEAWGGCRELTGRAPVTSRVFFKVEMFSLQTSTLFSVTWETGQKNVTSCSLLLAPTPEAQGGRGLPSALN